MGRGSSKLGNRGGNIGGIALKNRDKTIDDVIQELSKDNKENVYVIKAVEYNDADGHDEWLFTRQTLYYDDEYDNKWDITDYKTEDSGGKYKTHINQQSILTQEERKKGEYDDYWIHPDLLKLREKSYNKRNFVYGIEKYNSWNEYKKNY